MISITLYDYPGKSADIMDECFEKCRYYESIFSPTLEGSDIWNINNSNGQAVTISRDTSSLLEEALSYCEKSDGKIDITIEGVSKLWQFSDQAGDTNGSIPDSADIKNAIAHVDYKNVVLTKSENSDYYDRVTLLDSNTQISLGFIAKGYIADQIYDYLKEANVTSAVINLGGNIKCLGRKNNNESFNIGIQKPFDTAKTALLSVNIADSSVVSSGKYERYFYNGSTLFHHILDSKTGYPVDNNILSVSIITPSSTKADALSTLCFTLGVDEGLKLIESDSEVEAVFILDDYYVIQSSGLSASLNDI